MVGQLLQPVLAVRAPDDGAHLSPHDPGHVGDGLAGADLGEVAVDDHRVAAELGDTRGEGQLGAQGRLVEDDGHGLRPRERLLGVPVGLERGREVEDLRLLLGREVVVGEQVSDGHADSLAASSRIPGRASTKLVSWSVVMVSGGARRSASGATGLMMKP